MGKKEGLLCKVKIQSTNPFKKKNIQYLASFSSSDKNKTLNDKTLYFTTFTFI